MDSRTLVNMIESLEPGLVILNRDYTVSHINGALILMFSDFPRERLFRGDVFGVHREESRARVADTLRLALETERQIPLSLKLITQSGKDRYLLIKIVPLMDREGEDDKICALFYDITPFISVERKLTRVPVISRGEIHLLNPEEILYLKADNIYSRVFAESREYHCDMSLGTIEKRLPDELFCRIHRSYIVNITKVRKIHCERSECAVNFNGRDIKLPLSRSKLQGFLTQLGLR